MPEIMDVILNEIRHGFEAVNARLDKINGTVREHGQQIAVLEKQASTAEASAERNEDFLTEMNEQFLLHRARCPFDAAGSPPSTGEDVVVALANRIRSQRSMGLVGVGAAAAMALFELVPRVVDWMTKR